MYETQLTVVGNLLTEVDGQRLSDGTALAKFRVASKERRLDRSTGKWVDADRLFVDVQCWRALAENVRKCLKKGDPVVVTGRLFTRNYEHQGQRRQSITLEARSVAADLAECAVVLTRTRRGADGHVANDIHPDEAARGAVAAVDSRAVDDNGWGPDGGASTEAGGQGEPGTDGSRPHLVSVAPGDEG